MTYNYSYQEFNNETMARACVTNAGVSMKKSVEVARFIRGKKLSYAISLLEKVSEQKIPVPYKKYRAEMPHRRGKGIDAGGYPVHVANEFLRLLKSAQKNASEKEIGSELYVLAVSSRKGSSRYHYGRYAGRSMKSTNIEVIVGPRATKNSEESKK